MIDFKKCGDRYFNLGTILWAERCNEGPNLTYLQILTVTGHYERFYGRQGEELWAAIEAGPGVPTFRPSAAKPTPIQQAIARAQANVEQDDPLGWPFKPNTITRRF
jgi:hypothetical protein